MNKEDIIECGDFFQLEGVVIQGNWHGTIHWDEPPNNSVVAVSCDDAPEFFLRHGNNGKNYVVVSSASDFGPAYQDEMGWTWDAHRVLEYIWNKDRNNLDRGYQVHPRQFVAQGVDLNHRYCMRSQRGIYYSFPSIPSNIIHWYCVNRYINDEPRLSGVPFGIPTGNRDILWQVIQEDIPKTKDIYANFGLTNPIDREWVLKGIQKGTLFRGQNLTQHGNKLNTIDYYRELAQHQFCISPPGNGQDSYRNSEAIYLHNWILVDKNHFGFKSIYNWSASYEYSYILSPPNFEIPETLKLSYWKKQLWSHFEKTN